MGYEIYGMNLTTGDPIKDTMIQPIIHVQTISTYDFLLYFFCIFVTMIVFHEIGHLIGLWMCAKKRNNSLITPCVYFYFTVDNKILLHTGTDKDYEILTDEERKYVYLMGIVIGLLPMAAALFSHQVFIVLLLPYVMGIRKDLILLTKVWK